MKILQACESLAGGPAAYLEEILPFQMARYGAENIVLVAPRNQTRYLGGALVSRTETYVRTGRNAISLVRLGLAIREAVKRHNPDVVHLHSTFAGMAGRLALTGASGPKIVYCAHCWAFDRPQQTLLTRLYAVIERAFLPRTNMIIDISPHEAPLLAQHGLRPAREELVLSGIADKPPAAALSPRTDRPLHLLYIGRTDPQKGFDLLMKEFASIDPSRATLTVAGANITNSAVTSVPPSVRMLGWIARHKIPELIDHADAIIMPSRWEGMPLAALECLRAGRPLLASGALPFRSIVEDGVNGLLMDIQKPGFVGEALSRLEAADLPAMGAAARVRFLSSFQASRMNHELIEVYERLVSDGRAPGSEVGADLARAETPSPKQHSQRAGRASKAARTFRSQLAGER
jgi:glycosyltransferase involved in cell wall biosynthesis